MYKAPKDNQYDSQLQLKLLTVEINQLENYKKNIKVQQAIEEVRKENIKKYEEFKIKASQDIKKNILFNPYCWGSVGLGVIVIRSLVFGSTLGFFGYLTGSSIYNKFQSQKNV